jgi:hypothetical protein
MRGSAKPCLQQVDPDKNFAATLALVFPRRRMLRVVIGAKFPLRVFAVSATVLQGVNFDVPFEIAAEGEGFAALGAEKGFVVGPRGGVGLVGLGPMVLHCVLNNKQSYLLLCTPPGSENDNIVSCRGMRGGRGVIFPTGTYRCKLLEVKEMCLVADF